MKDDGKISDRGLYLRMSEPFEDQGKANDAIVTFAAELRAIREKFGIADIAYVVSVDILDENGDPSPAMTIGHAGDEGKLEAMFAYGFGAASAIREARIADMIKAAKRRVSK